ncbi:MAG: hypothetical protein AAB821_02965 [Patescibacteria group bacterium]
MPAHPRGEEVDTEESSDHESQPEHHQTFEEFRKVWMDDHRN